MPTKVDEPVIQNTLDYASAKQRGSRMPLVAMIVGLLSGPIAVALALACLSLAFQIKEQTSENLAIGILFVVLGGAFLFAIDACHACASTRRERTLALIGIIAPIAWAIAIVKLILLVGSNMKS